MKYHECNCRWALTVVVLLLDVGGNNGAGPSQTLPWGIHSRERRIRNHRLPSYSTLVLLAVCGHGWPSWTQTPPLTTYLLWVIPFMLRHSHRRCKMCVCLSLSNLALKQQTNLSHFHSCKSSSASAGPNINCCAHLHWAAFSSCSGDTHQTVFVHSSGPTGYVPLSLRDCGTQCRVRGARTLCSGCNHDEVCCTHHSSAVMNSADHRKAMASSH